MNSVREITSFSESEFEDIQLLMRELNGSICLSREALTAMMEDPNSHLYVIRDDGHIVACASLCVYHQPFHTDATIEAVTVSSACRGLGLGRRIIAHLLEEARRLGVNQLHLTSSPWREAANKLYQSMGFTRKETNSYILNL